MATCSRWYAWNSGNSLEESSKGTGASASEDSSNKACVSEHWHWDSGQLRGAKQLLRDSSGAGPPAYAGARARLRRCPFGGGGGFGAVASSPI
eukprot:13680398-Alexandrium_andersonii.AAC.1